MNDLILELSIDLTNNDQLVWQRQFINVNCAETDVWSLMAEQLTDEPPSLSIGYKKNINQAPMLTTKDYSIQELLKAIDAQYRRKKMYEYADGPKQY